MSTRRLPTKNKLFRLVKWFTPERAGIIYFFFYFAILMGAAWKHNLWLPTSSRNGLLREPSALINDLIFQPMIIVYYVWTRFSIARLLDEISENFLDRQAIEKVRFNYHQFVNQRRLHASFIVCTGVFAAIAYSIYTARIGLGFKDAPLPTWWSEHPTIYLIAVPLIALSCYAMITIGYRLITLIRCLGELFATDQIVIFLKHPDNAGGLGAIGKFSANLGWFLSVIGFMLSVSIIQNPENFYKDVMLLASIGIYLCMAPFLFLAPIRSAHSAMKAYHDKRILPYSKELTALELSLGQPLHRSFNENADTRRRIKSCIKDLELAKKYPLWPFNYTAVKKYISLILIPLVPGMLSFLLSLIF
jgi:hypothetical protein